MSAGPGTFFPPRLTPLLVRLLQCIGPTVAAIHYKLRLRVDETSIEHLRSRHGKTLLLLPNHPTFQDPIVMFLLSGRVGTLVHFLAAYELFKGPMVEFFQRMGVYSIRRAMVDRPSIAQTLDLLGDPANRLIIFPEGGCSFQNDTVMPFRTGAIQLALQAIGRSVKRGEPTPDLYAVPVSIKYRYTDDMAPAIAQTLQRLEQALGIQSQEPENFYPRLRAIAQAVLVRIEQEYGLATAVSTTEPWNDRIVKLRTEVLSQCEQQLGLSGNPNEPIRERAYRLAEALKVREDALENPEQLGTEPMSSPSQPSPLKFSQVKRSVFRLLNFDAIYDGYVAENPTPERFLDTLVRLEREVFRIDQPTPKGFREAWVKVGEPLNLKDYFDAYQRDRTGTIAQLVTQLQGTVQTNLDQL